MVDAGTYNLLFKNYGGLLPRLPASLKNKAVAIVILVLLPALIDLAYAAEDTVRGSTATTMPHPELTPYGIQKGGFVFNPAVSYSLSFDDNVFGTDSDEESSYITELTPSLEVNSNWTNHSVNFDASSSYGRNLDFSSEDYRDWSLGTDGRVDVDRDIKLFGGVRFSHEHVDRSAPDDSRGVEPTEFDQTSYFLRYTQKFGRIVGRINLQAIEKEYDDVDAIRFGIPLTLDNSFRDRTIYNLRFRLGYQYVGDEQVFISVNANERDYDKVGALLNRDKSSTGLEAMFGASFDYLGLLVGEVSAGYRTQDYDDPLTDIETPVAQASVHWNITDLTTLNFSIDQTIQESIDLFFSGYTSTTTSIGVDHELQRNLLLYTAIQYTRDKYEGIDPAEREDKTYSLSFGSTYKMNRNLYFSGQYSYLERKSDLDLGFIDSSQFDFEKNLISLLIQAQF